MNEKELMKKYPGEMIDPRMLDEEAKRSQYMYGSDLKTTFTSGTVEDPMMPRGYIEDLKNEDGSLPVDFSKPCNAPIDLYTDEAMEAYKAIRGPLDFSLEKELADINNEPPKHIAVIGDPRAQAEYIIAACRDAGIKVTQGATYDESNLIGDIDMRILSTAALGMKHLSANPYSNGRKPHIESEIDSNRKLDRTKQKDLNKKQGYGKRLTKKVKAELTAQAQREKNKQTIVVEYQDTLTLNSKF